MNIKRAFFIAIILLSVFVITPVMAVGNHTTLESGPRTVHEPTTYTWDMDGSYNLPSANYANYLQSLGMLLPGDKLQILPEDDPNPGAHGYHGRPGIGFDGYNNVTVGTKIGPFRVTGAVTYGQTDDCCKVYTFITEITVEDAPVMFQLYGGGTGWASANPNPSNNNNPQDYWGGNLVRYAELPRYQKIEYLYDIPGGVQPTNAEFYTSDPNPEVIWAEDVALTWNLETGENDIIGPTFEIYRPYLENYAFDSWNYSIKANGVAFAPTQLQTNRGDVNLESATVYFTSFQTDYTTAFPNGKIGDEDTTVKVYFRVLQRGSRPVSIAFNANRGKINGYSRRLIDSDASDYSFSHLEEFPASLIPTRDRFDFTGWYEDKACTKLIVSSDSTATQMQDKIYSYYTKHSSPDNIYGYPGSWHLDIYAGWQLKPGEEPEDISTATVTGIKTQTYNGKEQRQTSLVVTLNGEILEKDIDYKVGYSSLKNAGNVTMTITGIGDYQGKITKTFTRNKAKNTLTVKIATKTVYYSKVKSKAQVVKPITVVKKVGTLKYTKLSGSKYLTVNKTTGKVTVKKGTKKGTYKAKIKIYASGNTNYKSNYGIRTVTIKVK
ncbi:MAG: hypothetical protein IJL74_02680 [Bacilli bacterium]|nr:hypothetical protein [Bacilli bacterium]